MERTWGIVLLKLASAASVGADRLKALVDWLRTMVQRSGGQGPVTLCGAPRCEILEKEDGVCRYANTARLKVQSVSQGPAPFECVVCVSCTDPSTVHSFVTYCLRCGPMSDAISDIQVLLARSLGEPAAREPAAEPAERSTLPCG